MTLQTFPALPGLMFDWTKTPIFSSRVLTTASGKEQRAANWSYPRWKFSLQYEFLRSNVNTEFQTLIGFCNQMQGQYQAFYFNDTTDNTATTQTIGIGDGTTTLFPLVRTLGGYSEPITYAPTISNVSLNGVTQATPAVWSPAQSGSYGQDSIQFVTAPGVGVAITSTFTFYFTCRFLQDDPEFSNFMQNFWSVKKLEFESVK